MYELQKSAHKSHFATFSDSDHDERLLNESRGLSAWPGWLRDEAKAKSQLKALHGWTVPAAICRLIRIKTCRFRIHEFQVPATHGCDKGAGSNDGLGGL